MRFYMANDALGSIVSQGNFLRIDNAFVEEVSFTNRNSGTMLISYSVPFPGGITTAEQLRLNVTGNTVVLNSFRLPICFCDIRAGMWVDVIFSQRMTRSIPPQSNAFMIITRPAVRPEPNVTTGRVLRVDLQNHMLITGSPGQINSQVRYVVTNATVILNRNGFPIRLGALRPGQRVQVTHADFMTASIPPQTTAFRIQALD